jgi:Rrf2 family transcriptional regulator, cysteine metabolism repressor
MAMMRISTRGRYALRAMLDLAEHAGDGPLSRQEIAGRQELSADYIAQLFRRLQAAGLAEGVKGPGGGYRLARDAACITAGDVIRAVEGPVALVDCVLPHQPGEPGCPRVERCATHLLWAQISETVTGMLNAVTLQDLADQARQLAAGMR